MVSKVRRGRRGLLWNNRADAATSGLDGTGAPSADKSWNDAGCSTGCSFYGPCDRVVVQYNKPTTGVSPFASEVVEWMESGWGACLRVVGASEGVKKRVVVTEIRREVILCSWRGELLCCGSSLLGHLAYQGSLAFAKLADNQVNFHVERKRLKKSTQN